MGRTVLEGGCICAELQLGTFLTHLRNKGNQASLGGVEWGGGASGGRGRKVNDTTKGIFLTGQWVVAVVIILIYYTHTYTHTHTHTHTHTPPII